MTTVEEPGSGPSGQQDAPLLVARDLRTWFPIRSQFLRRQVAAVKAVDGVDLEVPQGQTLGIVGESGCGKSTLGRTLLRLLPVTSGSLQFDGHDLSKAQGRDLRALRTATSMIFQDPYSALNPRQSVGSILAAPFECQGVNPPGGVKAAVHDLMERVGLSPEHYNRFPAEFSGGQRQRIGIARALALRPRLVVCDEPVSALDVSVQAQVINLLQDVQAEYGMAYVFIAHDIGVVRHIADTVAVMYLGKVVEQADGERVTAAPRHPYTRALVSSVLSSDPLRRSDRERILLSGDLPSPVSPPRGCAFRTRCPQAEAVCARTTPPLVEVSPGHRVACHVVSREGTPNFG